MRRRCARDRTNRSSRRCLLGDPEQESAAKIASVESILLANLVHFLGRLLGVATAACPSRDGHHRGAAFTGSNRLVSAEQFFIQFLNERGSFPAQLFQATLIFGGPLVHF